jgi:hypothetical protein
MCIVCATDVNLVKGLLFLMSVFSKTLLTLVRCHLVLLSFLSAWHSCNAFVPELVGVLLNN